MARTKQTIRVPSPPPSPTSSHETSTSSSLPTSSQPTQPSQTQTTSSQPTSSQPQSSQSLPKTPPQSQSPQPPPDYVLKPAEELLPIRHWWEMKDNNARIDTRSFQTEHDIILAVIEYHPWKRIFIDHPLVPKVYLQLFWRNLKYIEEDKEQGQAEMLSSRIEDVSIDISVDDLRTILGLPDYVKLVDPFPKTLDALMKDIVQIGYKGDRTKSKLDWDLIPPRWQFLLQVMCNCLTGKNTGKDYATWNTLLIWTGFILCKKYDIAQLFFDEIKEQVIKREQDAKAEKEKKKKEKKKGESSTKPYILF